MDMIKMSHAEQWEVCELLLRFPFSLNKYSKMEQEPHSVHVLALLSRLSPFSSGNL